MSKITLPHLANLQNEVTAVTTLNANSDTVVTAIDNTLSRDGSSPNQMNASLDMNSNQILNLPTPSTLNSAARLVDVTTGPIITISTLPTGGSTDQTLVKTSGANFATTWNSSNLPRGGTSGQLLTKSSSTDFAAGWVTPASPTIIPTVVNVKTFGAVGDGVTDDTTAIQTAITTAAGGAAASTPITVFFPNGNYKITSALSIPSTCFVISLLGENRLGTKITANSGVNGLLYNASNFGSLDMRNLTWVTPAATSVILGSNTISISQATIDNCSFTSSAIAINVINGSAITISNCFFFQFSSSAIQISSPLNTDSGDSWIHKCYFLNSAGLSGTGSCVNMNSGGGWKITNNKMLACQFGVNFFGILAGAGSSDLHIEDNSIEGMITQAVLISNQSSVSGGFSNIIIVGNEIGGGFNGSGIQIAAPGGRKWVTTCLIAANVIRTTSGITAINVDGILQSINITGNCIDDANANPTGFAIQVGPNSSNGFITSNSITNFPNKVNNVGVNVVAVNNGP